MESAIIEWCSTGKEPVCILHVFFALFWFLFFYILEMELGATHTLGKCPTLTHISSPISCTANHPDVTHSAKYTMNAVQMTIRLDWVGNRDKENLHVFRWVCFT